jgi:hypothetical protein
MTQTHVIEWKASLGQDMKISLEQQGAAFDDELFPVSSLSRMRWGLSRYGFGGLNQEITLGVVDDEDEFFGLFNNVRRQDTRIVITVNDAVLFVGYPDNQQIKTLPYRDGAKEIAIKFYNPIAYKVILSRRQADRVFPFRQTGEVSDAITGMYRVHELLRNMMSEYGENILYSHRWRQYEDGSESAPGLPGIAYQFGTTCYLMFNQLWIAEDTFPPDNSIADGVNMISQSFFFRYGWSFLHQKPFVCQVDIGRVPDPAGDYPYIVVELQSGVIGEENAVVNVTDTDNDEMAIVAVETFYRFLPGVNEMLIDVSNRDVGLLYHEPYSEVVYAEPFGVFRETNPTDDILTDVFSFNSDIEPTSYNDLDPQAGHMAILADRSWFVVPPDPAISQQQPFRFSDPFLYTFPDPGDEARKLRQTHLHGASSALMPDYYMSELSAKLHSSIRSDVQENYEFDYMGILDPMINYLFRDKVICLYRGEYDLRQGTTTVNRSISLYDQEAS